MFALIVGGGRVGSYLAELLISDGHDIVVLEKRGEVFDKIITETKARVLHADGCDPEKLEEAGIGRADLAVMVTGDDEDNLVASWLAKHAFGAKRVIARVNNPRNRWLFGPDWGVDVPVSAVDIISKLILEEATLGEIITLLKLREGQVALVEVMIPAGASSIGQTIKDLALPAESVIVAIVRDVHVLVPKADTVIQSGDELLSITSVEAEEPLRAALIG